MTMTGNREHLFYKLGKLAGPKIRKAKWAWAAITASEAEMILAESAVGQDMVNQIRSQCQMNTDSETTAGLQALSARLSGHVKNKQRIFHVTCIETATPEAFCLPGGYIFISRALLNMCQGDLSQLSFVLAHEMAHILKGDVMERMMANALIKSAARSKGIFAVSGGLQTLGVEFLEKAYSRDQELHADQLGLQLMSAAGFDPAGATRLLEQLEPLEHQGLLGHYFSTHPNCRQRIAQLRSSTL